MPSFSKRNKKGGKRFNIHREGKKAEAYLQDQSNKKFVKNYGDSWKYGHLSADQALTGKDKYFERKSNRLTQSGKTLTTFDFDTNNEDNNEVSNNLDDFVGNERTRHYIRKKNKDNLDIDPSSSGNSDNDEMIDNQDEIFSLRRDRKRAKKAKENEGLIDISNENKDNDSDDDDDDEDLVSSGDDLDYENDNDTFHIEQFDENEDIDTQMKRTFEDEDEDDGELFGFGSDSNESEDNDMNVKQSKKTNDNKYDFEEIGKEIDSNFAKKDGKVRRILNISKKLNENKSDDRNENTQSFLGYESDDSDKSSESDLSIGNINDNNKKNGNVDSGVGNLHWGKTVREYYGADTEKSRLANENETSKWKEMRDEEAIAMQMQNDQMQNAKPQDFLDLEMMQLMAKDESSNNSQVNNVNEKDDLETNEEMKQRIKSKLKKKGDKVKSKDMSKWFNNDRKLSDSIETSKDSENIEKIEKDLSGLKESGKLAILKRDHPELIGILKELGSVVKELKDINNNRLKAIEMKFDDAIQDCTLFLDLNRTYATVLAFYLHLKVCGELDKLEGKHSIYGKMLQLRKRMIDMRSVYENSLNILNNLDINWDRDAYLKEKHAIKRAIKEKENENKMQKIRQEKLREKEIKRKKKNEKLRKLKREQIERKLISENLQKMQNWDLRVSSQNKNSNGNYDNNNNDNNNNIDNDLSRRQINMKIFKAQGLKRYRTKGIPRVKKRLKYLKKQKLWRRKGYKEYKGKIPNGRGAFNININSTHSVKHR